MRKRAAEATDTAADMPVRKRPRVAADGKDASDSSATCLPDDYDGELEASDKSDSDDEDEEEEEDDQEDQDRSAFVLDDNAHWSPETDVYLMPRSQYTYERDLWSAIGSGAAATVVCVLFDHHRASGLPNMPSDIVDIIALYTGGEEDEDEALNEANFWRGSFQDYLTHKAEEEEREVQREQQCTDLCIPTDTFELCVAEVLQDVRNDDDVDMTPEAVNLLQLATEDVLVERFVAAQKQAKKCKRMTVLPQDWSDNPINVRIELD
jgi:histone H3/H4